MKNLGKYLPYALGEILLIIIGILIAVNINDRQTTRKNNILCCQYQQELLFAIEHDILDVEDNLRALKLWTPNIEEVFVAIENKKLSELDSLGYKLSMIDAYTTFLQQSKGKIDELKYSQVNLIKNRALKNKILMYHETKIYFLLEHQRRFNQVNDKVEEYFIRLKKKEVDFLESDIYFYRLIKFKHEKNRVLVLLYGDIQKELFEIKEMINQELESNCSD